MTWSRGRPPALAQLEVSASLLPNRGSNHPAFVEMLFLWGSVHEADSRFRNVVLPHGFCLCKTGDRSYEVRDLNAFVRALVTVPVAKTDAPSIIPVKRFSFNVANVDGMFVGAVADRGSIVYRTKRLKTQAEAIAASKKWLDENRPKWDSYISEINFSR